MAGPLDWLPVEGATMEERLGITLLLLGAILVAVVVAREVRRRVDLEGYAARALNVGLAGWVLLVVAAVGATLVDVWNGRPEVETVLSAFTVESPVVLTTKLLVTATIAVGAYLITGFLKRIVYDFTQDRMSITQHQRELVFRTTQLSVYVLAGLVVFTVWGVNLGGLLVGAGFLGIVVGLAARQTLGSLIAGFVLMFARPFEIGDWVQIGDREGIVTEISIVNTRIQTFDGEYAMIPNDTVGSSEVINRTRKGRLRIQVDVGVDYSTDVEEAIDVAVETMRDVDDVLAVPQPRAVLKEFGSSSVLLNLRFWIDKPSARRKWRAQTAVIAAVKSAFDREGITIPFPQRVLSNRSAGEGGGFQVDAEAPAVDARSDAGGGGGAGGSGGGAGGSANGGGTAADE